MPTILLSTSLQRYCGGAGSLSGTGETILDILRDAASPHAALSSKIFGADAGISPAVFVHIDGELVTREELAAGKKAESGVIRLSLFVGGG